MDPINLMKTILTVLLALISTSVFGQGVSVRSNNGRATNLTAYGNLTLGGNLINTWDDVTNYYTQTSSGGGSGVTNNQYLPGVPVANGSSFTNIAASNIVSGGVLPVGTLAVVNGTDGQFLTSSNSNRVWGNNASGATNLNAANLATGTVPAARAGSISNHTDVSAGAFVSGGYLGWDAVTGTFTNGLPAVGAGGGGSATNLTPWTSAIDGGGFSLSNASLTGPLLIWNTNDKTNGSYSDATGQIHSNAVGSVKFAGGTIMSGTNANRDKFQVTDNQLIVNTNTYIGPTNAAAVTGKTFAVMNGGATTTTGKVIEYMTNSVTKFWVDTTGALTTGASITSGANLTAGSGDVIAFNGRGRFASLADGRVRITSSTSVGAQVEAGNAWLTNGIATLRSNLLPAATITVGASPYLWTNNVANTGSVSNNVVVYMDGVGVTGTVAINGSTVFNSITTCTVLLGPLEYTTLTYTIGTPTATWRPR